MKNKKDYIYEYSDLNLFQTRVKILTGEYKDIILEFADSHLIQRSDKPEGEFTFNYTLYFKPENLQNLKLIGNKKFEEFLSNLLINIIRDRKKDKKEKQKIEQVAHGDSQFIGKIKIDTKFYPQKTVFDTPK